MRCEHRRELKHDKFVDEMGSLSTRARENQRFLLTVTVAVIVAAVAAYGLYFYRRQLRACRTRGSLDSPRRHAG